MSEPEEKNKEGLHLKGKFVMNLIPTIQLPHLQTLFVPLTIRGTNALLR